MQHVGDITKINGLAVPIADCVVGGSPCQNLSVAGNREGLLGEESQLFHEQIRIVKEMRENDRRNGKPIELISPRYMVWENVPGAFSSNKGEDFRTVLEEVARVIEEGVTIPRPEKGKWATTGVIIGNGWSIAWRVFDAQYWGVPQRRRRICLVADFNGHTAPQIVFGENQYNGSTKRGNNKSSIRYLGNQSPSQVQPLCEGLSGYPNESRTEGQDSSTDAQGGFGASDCERGGVGVDPYNAAVTGDKASTIGVNCGMTTGRNAVMTFEPGIASREGGHIYEDVSGTIRANAGDNQMSVTYAIDMGGGKSSVDIHQDRSPTLTTTHYGEPAVVYDEQVNLPQAYRKQAHPRNAEEGQGYEETDKADTLNVFDNTEKRTPTVIVAMDRASFNQGKNAKYDMGIDENGIAHSMVAKGLGAVAYKESYGFDQGATRDVGALFLEEQSKTITNGSCPGHHNGVVIKTVALEGNGQRPSHHGDGYLVSDKSYTLNGTEVHGVAYGFNGNNVVRVRYIVRRLTPLECERLQGFPDGWTDIGEWVDSKGKVRQTSDAARYKALGNSIALPSWKWVIKRISAQYERDATMVSLFDGIGGFPHLWEQINGKGSCLWASEIEDFPMAVTKKRIG